MNPPNYASLEASQRLVEAKIVIETEAVWFGSQTLGQKAPYYELMSRRRANDFVQSVKASGQAYTVVPAPSMAEVWRELPPIIKKDERDYFLELGPRLGGGIYAAYIWEDSECYEHYEDELQVCIADNPTDALIDLLIWQRKERHERIHTN